MHAHPGGHFFCPRNFYTGPGSDNDMLMTPLSAACATRSTLLPPRLRAFLHRTLRPHPLRNAIFFIATCAHLAGANAAFSLDSLGKTASPAVVQTEQVRAELVAHAPDGVDPGKPCGWGCSCNTSPIGTPTGKIPATPACPPRCNGPCRAGSLRVISPGPPPSD